MRLEEENKVLVRRLVDEVIRTGNIEALDEYVASNFIDHTPFPGQEPGIEGMRRLLANLHAALPDARFEIKDLIAEGDKVVARISVRGTHQGELFGVAPTGKEVNISGIGIVRIADGKVVERWLQVDRMGLMEQLGAVPPIGKAA